MFPEIGVSLAVAKWHSSTSCVCVHEFGL